MKRQTKAQIEDKKTEFMDHVLDSILDLLEDYPGDGAAERLEQHIHTHLATELANIKDHGHRDDDPYTDILPPVSQFAKLRDLAEMVLAGNTEFDVLEGLASEALNPYEK